MTTNSQTSLKQQKSIFGQSIGDDERSAKFKNFSKATTEPSQKGTGKGRSTATPQVRQTMKTAREQNKRQSKITASSGPVLFMETEEQTSAKLGDLDPLVRRKILARSQTDKESVRKNGAASMAATTATSTATKGQGASLPPVVESAAGGATGSKQGETKQSVEAPNKEKRTRASISNVDPKSTSRTRASMQAHADRLAVIREKGSETAETKRGSISEEKDAAESSASDGGESIEEETPVLFLEEWMYELPIFKGCRRAFVEHVLGQHKRFIFRPGENVVRQGEQGSCMYVILWGIAEIYVNDCLLGQVSQGDCIGEMVVLNISSERTATVKAKTICGVIEVPEETFSVALDRFPEERDTFMLIAEGRNQQLNNPKLVMHSPCFRAVSSGFCNSLETHLHEKVHFPGEAICTQGQKADFAFILTGGVVSIEIGGREVRKQSVGLGGRTVSLVGQVEELEGGVAIFGELNLLQVHDTRNATVRATSTVNILILSRKSLQVVCLDNPNECDKLLQPGFNIPEPSSRMFGSVPQLAQCSEDFLKNLVDNLEVRVIGKGESVVMEENDVGKRCLFTLAYGSFEVSTKEGRVPTLPYGEFYGEIAALLIKTHPVEKATAVGLGIIQVLHQAVVLQALGLFTKDRAALLELTTESFGGTSMDSEGNLHPEDPAVTALQRSALFLGAPTEVIQLVADKSEKRVFLPGDVIVQQNSTGDSMFLLAEGSAVASIQQRGSLCMGSMEEMSSGSGGRNSLWEQEVGGREHRLQTIYPGGTFGELAVLGISRVRMATVRATSVCLTWMIDRSTVTHLLKLFPRERSKFADLVNVHLERSVTKRMAGLTLLDGFDKRLAVVLGLHCERKVFFAGQRIAQEGNVGDGLFVVNHGVVTIEIGGEPISTLHAGQYFGDSVILGLDRHYWASLTAKNVCQVLVISRSCFNYAVDKYPSCRGPLLALRVKIHEKTERIKQTYKGAYVRKRLMRRMSATFQNLRGQEGDEEEMPDEDDIDPCQDLRNAFVVWRELAKRKKELRDQRSEVMDLTTRRIHEWLSGRQNAMKKVQPKANMKALIERNINNRGPLVLWNDQVSTGVNRECDTKTAPSQAPTVQEVLIEDWPKPKPNPCYRLNVSKVLRHLSDRDSLEVLNQHGGSRLTSMYNSMTSLPNYNSTASLPNVPQSAPARLPGPEGGPGVLPPLDRKTGSAGQANAVGQYGLSFHKVATEDPGGVGYDFEEEEAGVALAPNLTRNLVDEIWDEDDLKLHPMPAMEGSLRLENPAFGVDKDPRQGMEFQSSTWN